jgi:hypothetical protein
VAQALLSTKLFIIGLMRIDGNQFSSRDSTVIWRRLMGKFSHRGVLLPDALSIDIDFWLGSESLIWVCVRILSPFGRWWRVLKANIQFSIVDRHLDATEMWEVWNNEHEFGNL